MRSHAPALRDLLNRVLVTIHTKTVRLIGQGPLRLRTLEYGSGEDAATTSASDSDLAGNSSIPEKGGKR